VKNCIFTTDTSFQNYVNNMSWRGEDLKKGLEACAAIYSEEDGSGKKYNKLLLELDTGKISYVCADKMGEQKMVGDRRTLQLLHHLERSQIERIQDIL
jgi:hypothetical protein